MSLEGLWAGKWQMEAKEEWPGLVPTAKTSIRVAFGVLVP
jgi:hypothetical protein